MKIAFYVLIFTFSVFNSFAQKKSVESGATFFLFPEFKPGVVLMKNGAKINTLLNYNLLSEKMIYYDNGNKLAIQNTQDIDTVFIDTHKFLVKDDIFIELKYHASFDIYVEHKSKLHEIGKQAGYGGTSQTSSIASYSSYTNDGRQYNLELPDGYTAKPYNYYLLKKNGEFIRFRTFKELSKKYRDKKELLKEYIKKTAIEFDNADSVVPLIIYMETSS